MGEPLFRFEWDENKAAANERKHGIAFEVASTIFRDPQLLSTPDLEHSVMEDRWFSVGWAANGAILSVVYLWANSMPNTTEIRLISARPATQAEIRRYTGNEAYA